MTSCFSSFGEDVVLLGILQRAGWLLDRDLLSDKKFYIDIGCYHPINHSNTYLFYKLGWNGILIDPNNSFASEISKERPRDLFINAAITDREDEQTFYFFSEGASSNTMDKKFAEWISTTQNVNARSIQVKSYKLDHIVESCNVQNIFLLNIDVEGLDKTIIQSYSWKVRPTFIVIEDWDRDTKRSDPEIEKFLSDKEYEKLCNLYLSSIYIDKRTEIYKVLS
jgi:FkbM family methyltransferase